MSDHTKGGTSGAFGAGDSLQSIIAALESLHRRFSQLETRLEDLGTAQTTASANAPHQRAPIVTHGKGKNAGGGSGSDPLTVLQNVRAAIASATAPLSNAEIVAYVATCRNAIVDLRAGGPSDLATAPHARVAYLMHAREAYLAAVGALLEAVRANHPSESQFQFA